MFSWIVMSKYILYNDLSKVHRLPVLNLFLLTTWSFAKVLERRHTYNRLRLFDASKQLFVYVDGISKVQRVVGINMCTLLIDMNGQCTVNLRISIVRPVRVRLQSRLLTAVISSDAGRRFINTHRHDTRTMTRLRTHLNFKAKPAFSLHCGSRPWVRRAAYYTRGDSEDGLRIIGFRYTEEERRSVSDA